MSAIEKIAALQKKLEDIDAQIEKYTLEENDFMAKAEAVGDKKAALKSEAERIRATVEIAIELSQEAEIKAQETFQAAQDAFATLYTKYKAGGITDADFAQYSAASGYDIPIEEAEDGDESEAEELEELAS